MADAFSGGPAGDAPAEYRSTFRNSEGAVPALLLVVLLAAAAIAALREVESGFDRRIELLARDGRRFRISQAMVRRRGERYGRPDPAAPLNGFAAAIRAAAAQAGHALPPVAQGLSFWNTGAGLALLACLFAISLAVAAGVMLALLDGVATRQPRGGEAIAIMLLLPVGVAWLWLRSFRRRRAVLGQLGGDPRPPRQDGQSAP